MLERWLREEGVRSAHTEDDLMEVAYERLRDGKIELPAEKELRRSVNAASHGFFQDLYACVSGVVSLFLQKNTNSDTTPGSPGPARRSGDRSLYAAQGQAPARARIRRYGGDPEEVQTKFVYRANWFVPDQTEGEPAETPATPGWEKARALDTLGASRRRAR